MQSILASVGVQVDRSEAQNLHEWIKQVLTIKGGNVVSEDREMLLLMLIWQRQSKQTWSEKHHYTWQKGWRDILHCARCVVKDFGAPFGALLLWKVMGIQ